MSDSTEIDPNGFAELWRQLKRRFFAPIGQLSFWTYLVIGVILFGGLAVWVEFVLYLSTDSSINSLKTALLTFFPALIGSVSTQLVFEQFGKNKHMLSFAMCAGVFFSLIALWLLLHRSLPNYISIFVALIACIAAILVWWIANGFNPAFQDRFVPEDPLGGDTNQKPSGNTKGFRV